LQKLSDELQNAKLETGLLSEAMYIPQTTALVRESDEGIAYLVMGNGPSEESARTAIAHLAEYVAGQMGVSKAQAFR
jgi:hypothetical protein